MKLTRKEEPKIFPERGTRGAQSGRKIPWGSKGGRGNVFQKTKNVFGNHMKRNESTAPSERKKRGESKSEEADTAGNRRRSLTGWPRGGELNGLARSGGRRSGKEQKTNRSRRPLSGKLPKWGRTRHCEGEEKQGTERHRFELNV